MRRWNGWGDDTIEVELEPHARSFLEQRIGKGAAPADASFEQACAQLAPGRLPAHPLVDASAAQRVLHALGQSLPDWLRLRHGHIGAAPDGVAFPECAREVRGLLEFASRHGADVIPYGGGTSVAATSARATAGVPC